ncbi:Crp/Fnr family transcriptional regulator [Algirhabdus cladophorae]|uniref:Crp/Fnr family transcriptional regulator n=1 Tax=Algirhabdus cladophorae TaxID=3377108 RepID=UPI003B845599
MVFEDAQHQILEKLRSLGHPKAHEKGDVLMRRGDLGDALVLLDTGRVEVSISTVFGSKSILGIYGPGTVLGDIACLDGNERSADVKALEPLTALWIARADLMRLVREDGHTAQLIIEALCQKVRNATEVLELRVLTTAKARLANALLRLMESGGEDATADGTPPKTGRIRVSQSWLGNYSGLTRENVNRQLRNWSSEGVARFENGEVIVLNSERLLDAALNDDAGA